VTFQGLDLISLPPYPTWSIPGPSSAKPGPPEGDLGEFVRAERAGGSSYRAIARLLEQAGVPAPGQSGKWHPSSVRLLAVRAEAGDGLIPGVPCRREGLSST
jgi:hypothetical protein